MTFPGPAIRKERASGGAAGISLVETLVALTVLSMAGAALVGLLVSSRVAVRLQGQRLVACSLAQTSLETAGRGHFVSLPAVPRTVTEEGVTYTVTTQAFELSPPVVGVRRVRSTVSWTFRNVARQEFRERIFSRGSS